MAAQFAFYFAVTLAALLTGAAHLGKDRTALAVALGLLIALPLGQSLDRSTVTYPFDHWGMYATARPPRSYYRFVARNADGRSYDYRFDRLAFISPGPRSGFATLGPVTWRLVQATQACRCNEGDPELDRLIDALRVVGGSSQRFIEFSIHEVAVSLHDAAVPQPIPRYRWNPGQGKQQPQ